RPLYRRAMRGAVCRRTGAAMGARCAPRPAAHHGGLEPARRALRARGDRPGRDSGAGSARGRAVRRQHRRGRRPRPDARRGHAACAGDRSSCCRPRCPARRRRRARTPATCRPNATTPRLRVDPVSLTRTQLRTLALAALGGALEFYDFVIFVFFATTMGALFFPADMPEWMRLVQTFGIFAAGYLARPLGGIVLAHFGDLRGRKRMFMLSIFMMAVPTLLMGLLPTYASIGVLAPVLLLLLRVMQGAAIGGEAPGAWVFVSEHVSPRHRSFACGALSAGLLAGILVGALVAAGIGAALTEAQLLDWGW